MAVPESAASQGKGRNSGIETPLPTGSTHTARLVLPILVVSIWMALGMPAAGWAQVVADPNAGANRPTVDQTANGLQ